MAIETYKVIDTYYVGVHNETADDYVNLKAIVLSLEGSNRVFIRYSHTMIPHEDAAGPWFSNSMTHADSPEDARAKIDSFAHSMSRAHKIVPWNENL